MPRVIKRPDIRRAEILDTAFAIFLTNGYENTSLNDVIARGGMSKGMFYHHFASKEALLLALFERVADRMYEVLRPIIADDSIDPKTKLQRVLTRSAEFRIEQARTTATVFVSYHRPESKILFQGINDTWAERFTPVMADIVRAGVATKQFDTFDPDGVADMMIHLAIGTKDLIWAGICATTAGERSSAAAVLATRLRFQAVALGRMLGLPDDSFSVGAPDFAHRFFELLNPIEN